MENSKNRAISEKNLIYLNKIFDLCEKNNIKVILLSTPSIKNWNYQRHYNIKKIAKQKNIQYFDMNLDKNLKINWKEDTKDRGDHLNYNGAKKVTKALGEYLQKLNILEDHRNDEIYDSWQKAAEKAEEKI